MVSSHFNTKEFLFYVFKNSQLIYNKLKSVFVFFLNIFFVIEKQKATTIIKSFCIKSARKRASVKH